MKTFTVEASECAKYHEVQVSRLRCATVSEIGVPLMSRSCFLFYILDRWCECLSNLHQLETVYSGSRKTQKRPPFDLKATTARENRYSFFLAILTSW